MDTLKNNSRVQVILEYIFAALTICVFVLLGMSASSSEVDVVDLEKQVIPEKGVTLPIAWGNLGAQLVEAGVIDAPRFESIYTGQSQLTDTDKQLLYGDNNKQIVLTRENARFVLNLLWAFGLSNKNEILETGPMRDPQYGGDAGRFASTGGWSLAVGSAMNHYNKHPFVVLTDEEQEKVERVSRGIYRPCCGNSTYFPDCNHGMAMLGLLELLAHNGATEDEMYKVALAVNAYWFPDTYMTLAKYFEQQGTPWEDVDPRIVLGEKYSSASGYQQILTQVEPQSRSGASCGV